MIVPLKLLQSLQETKVVRDDKYSFSRLLSPAEAETFNFTKQEVGGTPYVCAYSPISNFKLMIQIHIQVAAGELGSRKIC